MPTTSFPGIGAIILTLVAFSAIAKSSDKDAILFIFVPASGLYSYIVITGPGLISVIFPLIPKFDSLSSIPLAFSIAIFLSYGILGSFGSSKRFKPGSVKSIYFFFTSLSFSSVRSVNFSSNILFSEVF